ncbi:hypothetical protein ACFFF7_14160 [Novosphingobium aquiterrae]|uniref:Uncharacterized protein n=1 Tax=Novosphingobium aquiterrae TaxID=624388 RepID=A0ABV6PL29_9SPHN
MSGQLSLGYLYDSSFDDPKKPRDDFGSLRLSVQSADFFGRTAFWVQWQDVREFADDLVAYTASSVAVFSRQWGYNLHEGDDLIIRLQFDRLAKDEYILTAELADGHQPEDRVLTRFKTNSQAVLWFVRDVKKVMDRDLAEAILLGV